MTTYTSTVPVPYVDATGCHIPAFEDIYNALLNDYLSVYGADLDQDVSDQDIEWVGIHATALNNYCASFAAAYNAFSPATAQGTGLSSVVKVNGIAREIATYSTVDVLIIGVANTTTIVNGMVTDTAGGYDWALAASVNIPASGQILVTATCTTIGAISAGVGTVTKIKTPTQGWQSASNPSAAGPGAPVEKDPALRIRQTFSTAMPSQTIVEGIRGAVAAISGVTQSLVYENTADIPDANGIPGHCVSVVALGGSDTDIANAINLRKTGGGATYGTTQIPITDAFGITKTISFYRPTVVPLTFSIGIKPLGSFTAAIQAQIIGALVAWANGLGIGQSVILTRAYVPLALSAPASTTYEITYLSAARGGLPPVFADVPIAFDELPSLAAGNIQVALVTS